jgi:hypothetical protein
MEYTQRLRRSFSAGAAGANRYREAYRMVVNAYSCIVIQSAQRGILCEAPY